MREIQKVKEEIKIEIVGTPPLSTGYKEFRAQVWSEKVEQWESVGKEVFNGTLYRYMGMDGDTVKLGLMTYADRLVRSEIPVSEIEDRFGTDHVMRNCTVNAIPITTDEKIIVGIKKNSVALQPFKLGYIGGNMNEDEVKVKDFEDIYSMMMVEIEEESNIQPKREKLSFEKLGVTDSWASFYFTYMLDVTSDKIGDLFKKGEFVELVSMTREDIKNNNDPAIGEFDLSKNWIEEI